MASISDTPNERDLICPVMRPDSHAAPEPVFQNILAFTCDRIDSLRHVPADQPPPRSCRRKKIALRAECSGLWGISRCLISDFGDGGMALVCGHSHAVGEFIQVRWFFESEPSMAEVDCEVRHVTGEHVGVRFMYVSPQQRAQLVAALRSCTNASQRAAA